MQAQQLHVPEHVQKALEEAERIGLITEQQREEVLYILQQGQIEVTQRDEIGTAQAISFNTQLNRPVSQQSIELANNIVLSAFERWKQEPFGEFSMDEVSSNDVYYAAYRADTPHIVLPRNMDRVLTQIERRGLATRSEAEEALNYALWLRRKGISQERITEVVERAYDNKRLSEFVNAALPRVYDSEENGVVKVELATKNPWSIYHSFRMATLRNAIPRRIRA